MRTLRWHSYAWGVLILVALAGAGWFASLRASAVKPVVAADRPTALPVATGEGWGSPTQFSDLAVWGDTLWIATKLGGLVEWDLRGDEPRRLWGFPQDHLPSNFLGAILADERGLVLSGYPVDRRASSLAAWENGRGSPIPLPAGPRWHRDRPTALARGPDGTLYIGTHESGLWGHTSQGEWVRFDDPMNPLLNIEDLAVDGEGRLWVAGPRQLWTLTRTALTPTDFAGARSERVAVAPDGTVWALGRDQEGEHLVGHRLADLTWMHFTRADFGPTLYPREIGIDPLGRTWLIGGGGFSIYADGKWIPVVRPGWEAFWVAFGGGRAWMASEEHLESVPLEFDPEAPLPIRDEEPRLAHLGPSSSITSDVAIGPDGRLYVGTGVGLSMYEGRAWTHVVDPLPEPTAVSDLLMARDGRLWVGTAGGVAIYDGQTWQGHPLGTYVTRLFQDPAGRMWVGTRWSGAFLVEGEIWRNFRSELPGDNVWAFTVDRQGRVWMGVTQTWDVGLDIARGIAIYADGDWTFLDGPEYPFFEHRVVALATQPSTSDIWVGTDEGVHVFDGQEWESFTTENSPLVGQEVVQVAFGPDDGVWIATTEGVSVIGERGWLSLTTANSHIPGDVVANFAFDDETGPWLATNAGLFLIRHLAERFPTLYLPLIFDNWSVRR